LSSSCVSINTERQDECVTNVCQSAKDAISTQWTQTTLAAIVFAHFLLVTFSCPYCGSALSFFAGVTTAGASGYYFLRQDMATSNTFVSRKVADMYKISSEVCLTFLFLQLTASQPYPHSANAREKLTVTSDRFLFLL
jgi:hypothetical protein